MEIGIRYPLKLQCMLIFYSRWCYYYNYTDYIHTKATKYPLFYHNPSLKLYKMILLL